MQGTIHLELQRFVVAQHGVRAWQAILDHAGLSTRVYSAIQAYPDEEMMAVVGAASEILVKRLGTLLEEFGAYLGPVYLERFRSLIPPTWRTLDVIEHTESTIHRVVRVRSPTAAPPQLRVERRSPTEVIVRYNSARRMCHVAKGISRGIARHYAEDIVIQERACMYAGEPECVISIATPPT